MMRVVAQVFFSLRYTVGALAVTGVVYVFLVWLPNLRFIFGTLFSAKLFISEKLLFTLSTLSEFHVSAFLIAFLFGINVALLTYLLVGRMRIARGNGIGVLGAGAGLLGIGCASCGSVLASVAGLSGAVALLPLRGEEFLFLGVILLCYSIFSSARAIERGEVCVV